MCRMALMALLVPSTPSRPLDISRCVQMALVHDLAEAYVGDITPYEGITAEQKRDLEEKALKTFLDEMLGGPSNAQARERFKGLWEEYEARETAESRLVKDLDRLELVLQGVEYERGECLLWMEYEKGSGRVNRGDGVEGVDWESASEESGGSEGLLMVAGRRASRGRAWRV